MRHAWRLPSLRAAGAARRLPAAAAALLAVLVLAGVAWLAYSQGRADRQQAVDRTASSQQRLRQEHCVEGAVLFHDVRWAAVCAALADQGKSDGVAECELPGAEAQRLYDLLREAERKCMVESRGAAQ